MLRDISMTNQTLQDALSAMWAAYAGDESDPEFVAKQAEYRALSDAAIAANPAAHCAKTDPALWSFFSDFHKDYHGFRPRGEYTAAMVTVEIDRLQTRVKESGWQD